MMDKPIDNTLILPLKWVFCRRTRRIFSLRCGSSGPLHAFCSGKTPLRPPRCSDSFMCSSFCNRQLFWWQILWSVVQKQCISVCDSRTLVYAMHDFFHYSVGENSTEQRRSCPYFPTLLHPLAAEITRGWAIEGLTAATPQNFLVIKLQKVDKGREAMKLEVQVVIAATQYTAHPYAPFLPKILFHFALIVTELLEKFT